MPAASPPATGDSPADRATGARPGSPARPMRDPAPAESPAARMRPTVALPDAAPPKAKRKRASHVSVCGRLIWHASPEHDARWCGKKLGHLGLCDNET